MSQTATRDAAVRESAVHDLVLCLADSKRLLGMRYAEWILGAPELETGIACASMAQDEWGHGRLLYALLKDVTDVYRLEHGREPHEYRNIEVLDRPTADWFGLVAINALVDQALTVQLEALTDSSYAPLKQRVAKLIEEERFHAAHGSAWLRRLADAGSESCERMKAAAQAVLAPVMRWFGPDTDAARAFIESGVASATGSALRARYLERVRPLLERIGVDGASFAKPDFTGFDETTRRTAGSAPDAATIARIRGDKNRMFLMD
jgi:phenylacetate-CoA oxygenase PaaI subunit